jgi:hypothetical protein
MAATMADFARQNDSGPNCMTFNSLADFKSTGGDRIGAGPVGIILLEDRAEVDSTVRHHLDMGFKTLIVVGVHDLGVSDEVAKEGQDRIIRVHHDMTADNALTDVVNTVIDMAAGRWVYYCYNTEYLFFPFCEHRTIGEVCAFSLEERRDSVLTYVVDLYAADLNRFPDAVSIEDAHLDRAGYYALARVDRENNYAERQLDFFGGLRWRYEEHIPSTRRRIDRISIFRAKQGLKLRPDHTFSDPEYNTYACPWHHSLTATVCSFRTAKALKRNPGSGDQIDTFCWRNSAPFRWHSQQLLDLGLMEPGQWF